jgi:hypothetical protein
VIGFALAIIVDFYHKPREGAISDVAPQKVLIECQIDATDPAIDRLVYDKYGLKAKEIASGKSERLSNRVAIRDDGQDKGAIAP